MKQYRICAFGDSVLKGTVLESEQPLQYTLPSRTFTDITADRLGIQIDNYARFGSTVDKGERMLIRQLTRISMYDMALLKFGGNDCDYFWPAIAADPDRHHLPALPLTEFSIEYEKLLDRVRSYGPAPVILSVIPLDPERYFRHITRSFSEEGRANVLRWLSGTPEYIAEWHDMYAAKVAELASRFGVPFIDIAVPFRESGNPSELLCEDGIHPNLEGQSRMAEKLALELSKLMAVEADFTPARLAFC